MCAIALSEAKRKANNKFIKGTYDSVTLRVPKGKKAEIQSHTEITDESLNAFVNRAIDETMERDTHKDTP